VLALLNAGESNFEVSLEVGRHLNIFFLRAHRFSSMGRKSGAGMLSRTSLSSSGWLWVVFSSSSTNCSLERPVKIADRGDVEGMLVPSLSGVFLFGGVACWRDRMFSQH
jgi:hypothetical protein